MGFIERMKNSKWEIILVLLLVFIGSFLRAYNFSDWLHFEIDQSYDTLLVSPAVEKGLGNLPLLGPTAGGGRALRLGPAFYYLEYLSAKLFGNTPPGHAALVLIFSVFSLPLFYIFCKRYFSVPISIALLAFFSFSLYLVVYSRFSWSPNVLPFLVLLSFYSLLRSFSENEKNKDNWFLISSATISITTQIHFNAFFIVPAVAGLFFIIKRPRFQIKTWLLAIAIFGLIYSPVIISDLKTGGENWQFFQKKLTEKKRNSPKGTENIAQTIQYTASNHFLILTGLDRINGEKISGYGLDRSAHLPWRILGIIILVSGVAILLTNIKKETDKDKRDFLILVSLWFFISAFYYYSIVKGGFKIFPRFFLIISPLSFIIAGFILEKVFNGFRQKTNLRLLILATIILLILIPNIAGLGKHFDQLKKVSTEAISVETEDVFPNTARITLAQQYAIVDFIESKFRENNYPVYLRAKHEYESVIWYHLEKRGISYNEKIKDDVTYEQANYFFIFSSPGLSPAYRPRFTAEETKGLGSLSVIYAKPKPEAITDKKQDLQKLEIPLQKTHIANILTWKKIFSDSYEKNNKNALVEEENISEENLDDETD